MTDEAKTVETRTDIAQRNADKVVAKIEAETRKDTEKRFRKTYGHDPALYDAKVKSEEFVAEYEAELGRRLTERAGHVSIPPHRLPVLRGGLA